MKYYVCLIFILFTDSSLAGAWGVGSFDNDSALDWVYELESAATSTVLNDTFNNTQGRKYLEVDECSAAFAAAEIVASLNEKKYTHLPGEVQAWIKNNGIEVNQELKTRAAAAIASCKNSKISEVAQLWEESAKSEWISYISKLQSRLR